jgi:hypothetical protein
VDRYGDGGRRHQAEATREPFSAGGRGRGGLRQRTPLGLASLPRSHLWSRFDSFPTQVGPPPTIGSSSELKWAHLRCLYLLDCDRNKPAFGRVPILKVILLLRLIL